MIHYKTTLQRFLRNGEKTGWTYLIIPARVANKLKPGCKKSFRVKGKLDGFAIKGVALLPNGDGGFILPFNAMMRKGTKKKEGDKIELQLTEDKEQYKLNAELMLCLVDEPEALKFFESFSRSNQNYFSKWVDAAKTETTKVKRIAMVVTAMMKKQKYSEMIRSTRKEI